MKNRIASGGAAIVFGLLIALGPQFLFKVCPVAGDVIMKCHWSARAEIGIGALIAVFGAALVFFADPRTRLGITLAIFLTAVLTLLIPHALIGGCAMPFMPCRKITFPALTVIGVLLLIGAAGNLAYLANLIRKKSGTPHKQ